MNENFESSLKSLYLSEDLLEAVKAQSLSSEISYAICTYHNLSFCHYKTSEFEKSVPFLERALSYFNPSEDSELLDRPNLKIGRLKYLSKSSLNLSQMFAQLGNEEFSVKNARNAFEWCKELIQLCIDACNDHLSRHSQFNRSPRLKHRIQSHRQYNLMSSPHYLHYHESVETVKPLLLDLLAMVDGGKGSPNYLEVFEEFNQVQSEDVLGVKWISPEDLNSVTGFQSELNLPAVFDKICVLALSAHLIGNDFYKELTAKIVNSYFHEESEIRKFLGIRVNKFKIVRHKLLSTITKHSKSPSASSRRDSRTINKSPNSNRLKIRSFSGRNKALDNAGRLRVSRRIRNSGSNLECTDKSLFKRRLSKKL